VTPEIPVWLAQLSLALGVGTALVILADVARRPQHMAVMNVTWPITGLYLPVVGAWMYYVMGRRSHGGEKPFWQSVAVSSTHCGGGCALGDSVAAPLVSVVGFAVAGSVLLGHFVAEFAAAYMFGILFQYLPIRAMGQRSRAQALTDAVKADTLSLVAYEVGMFGWMAVASWFLLGGEPDTGSYMFWFMMQIAMAIGFLTTYPANWALVKTGIKHAM
jgi:hypothetical protein